MSSLQFATSENDTYKNPLFTSGNERQGIENLEKLITLLEQKSARFAMRPLWEQENNDELLSLQARLRSAYAAYGLATGHEMVRVGAGAWLHRRHA